MTLSATEQECVVTLSHPDVGTLTFHEADGAPVVTPYQLSLMAGTDTSFGTPPPLVEVMESLLAEGAEAYLKGWDNRQFPLVLRCEADSGEALAQFEDLMMGMILAARPGSMATLRYVPPARESAPTNFDVQTLALTRVESDRWDLDESQRLTRYWRVDFTTLPFVRPDEPVVIEASPLPPEPPAEVVQTSIAPTNTLTGWTPRVAPASAFDGGATEELVGGLYRVKARMASRTGGRVIARRDSGDPNATAAPYIYTITTSWPLDKPISLSFDGGPLVESVARAVLPGTKRIKSWFPAPAGGWSTSLGINGDMERATSPWLFPDESVWMQVEEVGFTTGIDLGPGTTSREQSRSLAVPGAAPTAAQLMVYADVDLMLGETVLIHTANDDATFTPPLRPYRFSSATVATDASAVSGSSNDLSTATQWLIPVSQLLAGTYTLAARMKRTAGSTTRALSWTAKLVDSTGDDLLLGSDVTTSGSTPVTLAGTDWQPVVIGSMALPPIGMDAAGDACVLIELSTSAGSEVLLDQSWLLDTTHGTFTLLYLPSAAGFARWVECRTPDLGAPLWQVYGGTGSSEQGGQDLGRYVLAFGRHRFLPGDMKIFTVTSGAYQSQTRGKMYARHHSHVTYGADQTATPSGGSGTGGA